jgi:2,5-diamino-6-(ribosylamino)-4(3H)-pyrimidinone 5'-phosphate reductase
MLGHGEKRQDNKVKTLSTHLKDKEEKIRQLIQRLIDQSERGAPTIVEGKNDEETLRRLGVQGRIICAKTGGKSRLDLVAEIEGTTAKEVILLLDFDRRGKEWTKAIKQSLENLRVKADTAFWSELHGLAGRELKDIEGLAAYLDTLKKKIGEIWSR